MNVSARPLCPHRTNASLNVNVFPVPGPATINFLREADPMMAAVAAVRASAIACSSSAVGGSDPLLREPDLAPSRPTREKVRRITGELQTRSAPCAAGAWYGRGLVCYASCGKEENRRLPEHSLIR